MTGYTGAAGQLTRRQREVLDLVKAGLKRHEIAARLGISPETVKSHAANIATRIDARTAQRATTAARRRGDQP